MKIQKSSAVPAPGADFPVVANFGTARFVKNSGGNIELVGGTADDHADAREWCSLFAPETVFTSERMEAGRVGFFDHMRGFCGFLFLRTSLFALFADKPRIRDDRTSTECPDFTIIQFMT